MPLRSASNGRDALRGVVVLGQRPLAVEAGKNAERADALRDAARQGDVAIAQPQHLHALDDARVAGGAGCAERVVRAGDAEVQRDFAGRIVGHRPRIVVMRPILGVVVVAFELVDFVFRLDVAVLGHADVNADPRAVDVLPVEARIGHRLVGAIDADAAGAGAAADLLALLVAQLVEIANPRQGGAEIAGFVGRHPAAARQKRLAELGQRVSVRRGKSHARNDNPLLVRPLGHGRRKLLFRPNI